MENLPIAVPALFIILTLVTIFLFFKASQTNKWVLVVCVAIGSVQSFLAVSGFYQETGAIPPRILFLLSPSIGVILGLFFAHKGKKMIDTLDIKKMTLLHTIRIPVELLLYSIFRHNLIPVYMTFDGYNYDIISGITAPIIYYIVFYKKQHTKKILLIWNFICLTLLLTIIAIAVLSAKSPFQTLAFDQPNIGITYFPFVWLPSIIVPIVLLSHLASIRQLLRKNYIR